MIKTIILDDHQLFIDGLIQAFQNDDQVMIVDYALDGTNGIEKLKFYKPDVVLLDIDFTRTKESGVDILKTIRKSNLKIKVLVLTSYCDKSLIDILRIEGANGYRVKNIGFKELKQSIIDVYAGEVVFKYDAGMIDSYDPWSVPHVSERAVEIIRLLSQGYIIKEIAQKLGVAETTVNDHIERTRRKLDAKNNSELVYIATKNRII
jgi:DNA-binding NarL/FixJ family response regulator